MHEGQQQQQQQQRQHCWQHVEFVSMQGKQKYRSRQQLPSSSSRTKGFAGLLQPL
jgi:hypothetical protein